MDLSEQVRELLWDGWDTQKDKFLSELPKEEIEMSKVDITDNALTNKDGEILRLLNQIASDMVKRSDVDEMIAAAVKEAVDKVNAENERKMKAMAAEYEAVIASLKKKDKEGKKGGKWRVWISPLTSPLTQSCKLCNVN